MKKKSIIRIGLCLSVLVCTLALSGCQTHYYPPTKDHATKGKDGKWYGPVKKEGVPDWSPGKNFKASTGAIAI